MDTDMLHSGLPLLINFFLSFHYHHYKNISRKNSEMSAGNISWNVTRQPQHHRVSSRFLLLLLLHRCPFGVGQFIYFLYCSIPCAILLTVFNYIPQYLAISLIYCSSSFLGLPRLLRSLGWGSNTQYFPLIYHPNWKTVNGESILKNIMFLHRWEDFS